MKRPVLAQGCATAVLVVSFGSIVAGVLLVLALSRLDGQDRGPPSVTSAERARLEELRSEPWFERLPPDATVTDGPTTVLLCPSLDVSDIRDPGVYMALDVDAPRSEVLQFYRSMLRTDDRWVRTTDDGAPSGALVFESRTPPGPARLEIVRYPSETTSDGLRIPAGVVIAVTLGDLSCDT